MIWEDSGEIFVAALPEEDDDGFQPQMTTGGEPAKPGTNSMGFLVGNLIYNRHHMKGCIEHGTGRLNIADPEIAFACYTADFDELRPGPEVIARVSSPKDEGWANG